MAKSKRNFPIDEGTSPKSENSQRDVSMDTDPGVPIVFVCEDVNTKSPWVALVPALGIAINTGVVGYKDWRDLMNIVHECLYALSKGITDPRVCAPTVSVKASGKVMTRQSSLGILWDDLLTRPEVPAIK